MGALKKQTFGLQPFLPRLVVTELQPTTRHIDKDDFCQQHLGCDEPDLNYSIHYFDHNQHYLFSVVKKIQC